MSSSGYDSVKENVIQHRIWWRGDGSTKANDEIEQLAIKEGDTVLFFDTLNKEFCLVAEASSIPKKASELENFVELTKSVGITPDRLAIQFKDTLIPISFEINKENFNELKELGLFGNTRSFETVGRYLQRKSRGRLTKFQSQEKNAFQYILEIAGKKESPVIGSEVENTINIDEDWQIFKRTIDEFSEKFRKHPSDYIWGGEKAIQYLLCYDLTDKFGDWYELIGEDYPKVELERPNRHDIVIYANRKNEELVSIACEIKLIWGDDINNLIDQMKATDNSVLADIQKLKKAVLSNEDGIIIKSGAALVFTNIKILGERAILAEAANLLSITKSNVKLIIVGADGVLTFDKN